jgi:hypothetical protein
MASPTRKDELLDQAMENLLGKYVAPEVLAELDDILATKPSSTEIGNHDALAWIGRVKAALHSWDSVQATNMITIEPRLHSGMLRDTERGYREILTLIHQARSELRLRVAPAGVVAGKGMVFDYFDGVRKAIETASSDLLFVDPYLDADFVSRYLAFVPPRVQMRLLTREKLATLLPAVDAFAAQRQEKLQVRSSDKMHDRYVFIDGRECYQSGASFKDGARNAPTTLTPIVDAFPAVKQTYEAMWASAKVER